RKRRTCAASIIGTRLSSGPQLMKQWRQAMLQTVPVSWNQTVSSALSGTSGARAASRMGKSGRTGRRELTGFENNTVLVLRHGEARHRSALDRVRSGDRVGVAAPDARGHAAAAGGARAAPGAGGDGSAARGGGAAGGRAGGRGAGGAAGAGGTARAAQPARPRERDRSLPFEGDGVQERRAIQRLSDGDAGHRAQRVGALDVGDAAARQDA